MQQPTLEEKLYSKASSGNRGLFTSGPHGLGDPWDQSLSNMEINVAIPARLREIISQECCNKENEEYEKCRTENWFFSRYFKCSLTKNKLNECVEQYMHDKDLYEKAKTDYMEDRFLFRSTGLDRWEREHPEYVERKKARRWIRDRKPNDPPPKSLIEEYRARYEEYKKLNSES